MSIEEYLDCIPQNRKERFSLVFNAIIKEFPKADISMTYKMPTFKLNDNWLALGNQKNYISLYTCCLEHILCFKNKYPNIKTGKGCINLKDKDTFDINDLIIVAKNSLLD